MKNINLTTARKICDEARADEVILIAFKDGNYASASWGKDRLCCERYGRTLSAIGDRLESGEIKA